jgi:hypothetical protein
MSAEVARYGDYRDRLRRKMPLPIIPPPTVKLPGDVVYHLGGFVTVKGDGSYERRI